MICSKCGKQLGDGCLFCTECGSAVNLSENRNQSGDKIKSTKIMDKINNYIEGFGDKKANKYLSIAAIISMISIRLLGFVVITVLITILNSILIYYNFKRNSRIDMKMIALSLAVLLLGILIVT